MNKNALIKKLLPAGIALLILMGFSAAPAAAAETDNFLILYIMGTNLEDSSNVPLGSLAISQMLDGWNPANGKFLVFYGSANKPGWNDGTAIADRECLIADFQADHIYGSDMGVPTKNILGKIHHPATSGEALLEAVQYANNYAKENGLENARRWIVLWDHGGGPLGMGPDIEHTLSNEDIKRALSASDKKFDLVIYDACLMGNLETAYAVKDSANYLAGSEEQIWKGLNHTVISSLMTSNSYTSSQEAAKKIGEAYLSDNREQKTFSVIDLGKIDGVVASLDKLGSNLTAAFNDKYTLKMLSYIYRNTEKYYVFPDLYQFAEKIGGYSKGEVHDAAESLMDAIDDAVLYSAHNHGHGAANGLSISHAMALPKVSGLDGKYTLSGMEWTQFLKSYITKAQTGIKPKLQYVDVSGEDEDAIGNLTISGDNGQSIVMIDFLYLKDGKYYILAQTYADEILMETPESRYWTEAPTGTYSTGNDWDPVCFAFTDGKEGSTPHFATLNWDSEFMKNNTWYVIYTISGDLTRKIDGKDVTYKSLLTAYYSEDSERIETLTVQTDMVDGNLPEKANLWMNKSVFEGDVFTPYLNYYSDGSSYEIFTEKGTPHTFSATPEDDIKLVNLDEKNCFWDYEIKTLANADKSLFVTLDMFDEEDGVITSDRIQSSNGITQDAQNTRSAKSPLPLAGVFAALVCCLVYAGRK